MTCWLFPELLPFALWLVAVDGREDCATVRAGFVGAHIDGRGDIAFLVHPGDVCVSILLAVSACRTHSAALVIGQAPMQTPTLIFRIIHFQAATGKIVFISFRAQVPFEEIAPATFSSLLFDARGFFEIDLCFNILDRH